MNVVCLRVVLRGAGKKHGRGKESKRVFAPEERQRDHTEFCLWECCRGGMLGY